MLIIQISFHLQTGKDFQKQGFAFHLCEDVLQIDRTEKRDEQ